MEPMIILWCESENRQWPTYVSVRLFAIYIAQQSRNAELAALDPELCSFGDGFKDHETAVGGTDEAAVVVGAFDRSGRGLEFTIEEVIEGF